MEQFISRTITDFITDYAATASPRTAWKKPLVAFADSRDPLFDRLKTAVRPTHAHPEDLLTGARSVIVYFIPFAKDIPLGNRKERLASTGWAAGYVETNSLIVAINQHLAGKLAERGHRCTVLPPTHNFDTEQLMSDWSHKHVAYIAGLGNFGTHHLLITREGCCGRLGSLITDIQLQAGTRTDRPACLHLRDGSCLACVAHCPSGALTAAGFDRHRCYALLLENVEAHTAVGYADVCGKCCCVMPCSFTDPVQAQEQRKKRDKAGGRLGR